jgi:hypothetical protein
VEADIKGGGAETVPVHLAGDEGRYRLHRLMPVAVLICFRSDQSERDLSPHRLFSAVGRNTPRVNLALRANLVNSSSVPHVRACSATVSALEGIPQRLNTRATT